MMPPPEPVEYVSNRAYWYALDRVPDDPYSALFEIATFEFFVTDIIGIVNTLNFQCETETGRIPESRLELLLFLKAHDTLHSAPVILYHHGREKRYFNPQVDSFEAGNSLMANL